MFPTMYCMRVKIRLQRGATWRHLPDRSTAGHSLGSAIRSPGGLRPGPEPVHGDVPLRAGPFPDSGAEASAQLVARNDTRIYDKARPVLSADWTNGWNHKQVLLCFGAARYFGSDQNGNVRNDCHECHRVRGVSVVLAALAVRSVHRRQVRAGLARRHHVLEWPFGASARGGYPSRVAKIPGCSATARGGEPEFARSRGGGPAVRSASSSGPAFGWPGARTSQSARHHQDLGGNAAQERASRQRRGS